MMKGRNITAWITCKTHGSQLFDPKDLDGFKMCDDVECTHCTSLRGAIKAEAELMSEVFFGEDYIGKVEHLTLGEITKRYHNALYPKTMDEVFEPNNNNIGREELIQKYLNNGGKSFDVIDIDIFRDGGTIRIETSNSEFFHLDKEREKIDLLGVEVVSDATLEYLKSRLERYIQSNEYNTKYAKIVIDNIK